MEGHLYVNEDEYGSQSDIYTKRYFILFPFCGMRWFLQEPGPTVSYNSLLQHDIDHDFAADEEEEDPAARYGGETKIGNSLVGRRESGWVCGGNVKVESVTLEQEFVLLSHDDTSMEEHEDDPSQTIYPFLIKLRSGDNTIQVRLASDSEAERLAWVHELHGTFSVQNYLVACVDKKVRPSRRIFTAIRNVAERKDVHFENMPIAVNVLGSVVKYVQLSAPHGCMLHSLRLENAQIMDEHSTLLCALLRAAPHVTVFSLAENSLSDQGAISIATAIEAMTSLRDVDFSCNRIGDVGIEALVVALRSSTRQLERLDISRNALTPQALKALVLHVSGHNSQLKILNLSYNALGNGGAALVSILMRNKPSVLQDVDLSYAGVTEGGIKELASSITDCDSLLHIKLKGNIFSDPDTLMALVDAVSRHQKQNFVRGAKKSGPKEGAGLTLHLGGLKFEQQMPRCLSFRSVKKALPYVEDHTLVRSVILRRRLLVGPNPTDDANAIVLPKESVVPIVSFRVQLPLHIYSVQEFVEALAGGLKAHPQQLRVVSSSSIESLSRSCNVEVLLEEATPRSLAAMRGRTVVPIYTARLPPERVSSDLIQEESRCSLPTIQELIDSLRNHCREDSPLFRRLGIRNMTLQAPPQPENPNVVTYFKGEVMRSGCGGRMNLPPGADEHVPLVTPYDANHYSMDNMSVPDDSDDEEQELESWRERDHRLANVYYSSGVSDIVDTTRGVQRMQISNEVLKLEREAQRSKDMERKQRRMVSEQLVQAVRQLRRDEVITTPIALFWEGAFGNAKFRSHTIDALRLALNDHGIFHAVGRWNLLCEAMSVRDTPVMAAQIMHMKEDSLDGGTAMLLGQRLLSEIISLQRDAINLDSLATQPENISFVENFLLTCGKLGYSGPEMTDAADHRKKLILWAADEHPELIASNVDLIRQRALMSNLMISRDFPGLASAVDEIKGEKGLRVGTLAEVIAARALLRDFNGSIENLIEAVKLRRIPRLEKALAEAAFIGIGLDNVHFMRATRALATLCSVPAKLLKPIVVAMREGEVGRVENALEAAYSMGWRCPALGLTIAPQILYQMKEIASKDQARATLVRLALSVKNGYRVNAGEVLQLLRRAESLKLIENDESIAHHFEQLGKYVKRFSSVLKQEKDIQRMIDDDDYEGLKVLLSGRGKGRLVVSCSSEELCRDWLEMIQAACIGVLDDQPVKDDEMLMAGSMEKAARSSKEHLFGWRSRYFVLQGKSIQYYTTRNGERKGAIRVFRGAARRLQPEEADGRKFSIEILEGRDLSILDKDLLAEAKATVDKHLEGEVVQQLQKGISEESLELLEVALLRVDVGVQIDFNLVRRARSWVKRLRERNLKKQLQAAGRSIPKGQIEELISLANSHLVDPTNALLCKLVRILEQTDLCQCVLRARGAIEMRDETAFRRAITSLGKFEIKRFTSRDMRMTTAVFLQHGGYRILRSHVDGDASQTVAFLKHILASCRQLAIETEAMQVAKLLVSMGEIGGRHEDSDRSKSSGLLSYLDESKVNIALMSAFTIDQFPYLRHDENAGSSAADKINDAFRGVGSFFNRLLGSSQTLQQANHKADKLAFTEKSLSVSMLKWESTQDDRFIDNLAKCCFQALQVVMGDRPIAKLKRSQGGQIKPRKDEAFVINDLVDVGTSDYLNPKLTNEFKMKVALEESAKKATDASIKVPVHKDVHSNDGDELYVQLCKQLSGHPRTISRLRGWLLFSIYLHTFAPTAALLPYLRNFIAHSTAMEGVLMQESMSKVKEAHEKLQELNVPQIELASKNFGTGDTEADRQFKRKVLRQEELEARASITKVASYCLKVLSNIPLRNSQVEAPEISRTLCAYVLGRATVSFKITLLTGSEYTFSVKYGEIDTPYSLLPMLYGRLISGDGELKHIIDTYSLRSKHRGGLASAWQDWLLTIFRGAAFYLVGEGEEINSIHDLPVQADDASICDWTHDILWDLITDRAKEAALRTQQRLAERTGKHSSEDEEQAELSVESELDTHVGLHLVLRRRVSSSTEALAGQLELFEDQVADNDLVALRGMWIDWLISEKALPADHVRVDMLFAEESRCVNSHVYQSQNECFYYLLGLQLALSWENTDEIAFWGEGATSVLSDCDLSIRPIHAKPFDFKSSLHSSRGGSVSSGSRSRRASKVSRLSTFFRRSVIGSSSEVQRIGENFRKRLTLKDANSFALFGDVFDRSGGEGSVRSDTEASQYNDDDGSEFEETSDGESTYNTEKHDQPSPETSDDEYEKESKRKETLAHDRKTGRRKNGHAPVVSYNDLYDNEVSEIRAKVRALTTVDPKDMEEVVKRVVEWMACFHQITDQPSGQIATGSPQYRYLLKRAYLQYLQTWPLYGYHYSEAVLLDGQSGQRNVIVGVSPNGLLLLDPDEWTLVLQASLHDIEKCVLNVAVRKEYGKDDDDFGDDDSEDKDSLGPVDDIDENASSDNPPSDDDDDDDDDSIPTSSTFDSSSAPSRSSESSSQSSFTSRSDSSRSSSSRGSMGRGSGRRSKASSRRSKLSTIEDGNEDDSFDENMPPNSEDEGTKKSRGRRNRDSDSDGSLPPSDDDKYNSDDETRSSRTDSRATDSSSFYSGSSDRSSRSDSTSLSGRTGRTNRTNKTNKTNTTKYSAGGKSTGGSPSSLRSSSTGTGADRHRSNRDAKLLRHDHIVLTINGEMTISLVGNKAKEQKKMLEQCSLEVLGRGMFPHGSEGGNDLLAAGEPLLAANDTKEIMRKFVREFPILPIPPIPQPLVAAPDFRPIPKSKIEAKLLEREEGERVERENAERVRDMADEKIRRDRLQGKELVKSIAVDDDGDGIRRSDITVATTSANDEPDETGLNALVSQAVCGVPSRSLFARNIPAPPTRLGGRLHMDSHGGRVAEAPQLAASIALHPSSLPPVGTAWESTPQEEFLHATATPSKKFSPASSPKRSKAFVLPPPRWSEHASHYMERSNKLLEGIVESEQLIGEHRAREKDYFFVGTVARRREKKEKGTKF